MNRALTTLRHLVDNIGTRHSSLPSFQNNTLLYLLERLYQLKNETDPSILLEIDLVRSPPYAFKYFMFPNSSTVLAGSSLLVARLSKKGHEQTRSNTLLLSCHADSVPRGFAAFDASQGCAIHLEVLRVLSAMKDLHWKNGITLAIVSAEHGMR